MTAPRLLLSACLSSALILGLVNWPGITMAVILVGGSIAAIVAGLWLNDCRIEADEFNEEHDL
jgi:hypothetical protein